MIDIEKCDGAEFSRCRKYRYTLWRRWDFESELNQCMFIGLNPSTADETNNDPTVRRCIRFAKDWGYTGLLMMNAYGFRATDPKVMKAEPKPVGPGNDKAFAHWGSKVGLIVAAPGRPIEFVGVSSVRERFSTVAPDKTLTRSLIHYIN